MPILYVCVINKKKTLITEAFGTKNISNYLTEINKMQPNFILYGRKVENIGQDRNLYYKDQKTYSTVCVYTNEDITDLEASKFVDKIE